ncbi:MAG: hypothetical protein FJ284_00065 [Planctomycetes bacterium]|nr:hypothetical protein [Planctomycetota bacterium]
MSPRKAWTCVKTPTTPRLLRACGLTFTTSLVGGAGGGMIPAPLAASVAAGTTCGSRSSSVGSRPPGGLTGSRRWPASVVSTTADMGGRAIVVQPFAVGMVVVVVRVSVPDPVAMEPQRVRGAGRGGGLMAVRHG